MALIYASSLAEKRYHVVGSADHWRILEDDSEPAGDYAKREGALEAVYLDIKHGISIRAEPPPDAPSIGGKP
jgi:hypothetical protein